ncbi:MAG: pyridoxamine 5'-phosphate oxidase family protein [Treponema sp.]|jgi:nitroimidazol reductase NimA-like FMN-containing flavoprotein (pyridoxamine 5'-phosphate oxidase superfamily)|nr:pyridoxamine 5'-phosphate oxidase family protein [Treponema sp.]
MRRKDREVSDVAEILGIIKSCKVCRLGMAEDNLPYVVPLNFGYEYEKGELVLYFHGAKEGKKIDVLKKNSRVCFEMDGEHQLTAGANDGAYGFNFASVIGFGTVEFVEAPDEKVRGLCLLLKHQTGEDREFSLQEAQVQVTAVWTLRVETFTGKRRAIPVPGTPPTV